MMLFETGAGDPDVKAAAREAKRARLGAAWAEGRADVWEARAAGWRAPEPPDLRRYPEIVLDFETTGLKWHAGDLPVGVAVRAGGQSWYLPWGHKGGGNLDESTVKRWAQTELRGKNIVNIKTEFDIHMSEAWGVNLREQGNTFRDVAHTAALLDDHRARFNLNDLSAHWLGIEEAKEKLDILNKGDLWMLPAGMVAPYAERDVELVDLLRQRMEPELHAQDLMGVQALEDSVIPVVVEMEANGVPLDMDLLTKWERESREQMEAILLRIKRGTGVDLCPTKSADWARLFAKRGHAVTAWTPTGQPSFDDEILKAIQDPYIDMGRHARNIASIRSRSLVKYLTEVGPDGILRYNLHQLPFSQDEIGGGTVSGRFSSSSVNIQQVSNKDKHKRMSLMRFFIRRLFLPGDGEWLSADAKQIEYRLFAHYTKSKSLIDPYFAPPLKNEKDVWIQGPLADFHAVVMGMLQPLRASINRTETKCVNFAQIYGAGLVKFAVMLGMITEAIAQDIYSHYGDDYQARDNDPRLKEARAVRDAYHQKFPQVKPLLKLASSTAMPRCDPNKCRRDCSQFHRGYVHTYLGRRARFRDRDRHYSSLNRVIQGTAADVNKRVLVEVYKERKRLEFIMRITNHDEIGGSLLNLGKLSEIREILDRQYYPFHVPILWEIGTGANWGEAH